MTSEWQVHATDRHWNDRHFEIDWSLSWGVLFLLFIVIAKILEGNKIIVNFVQFILTKSNSHIIVDCYALPW
jgi:hypothetical protein